MLSELQWPITLLVLGVSLGVVAAWLRFSLRDGDHRQNSNEEKLRRVLLPCRNSNHPAQGKALQKMNNSSDSDINSTLSSSSEEDEWEDEEEDENDEEEKYENMRLKMVFVIRQTSPKLSAALSSSLVCQAAISVIEDRVLLSTENVVADRTKQREDDDKQQWDTWYKWWRRIGAAKIALKGPDNECTLQELVNSAKGAHLPVKMVSFHDVGQCFIPDGMNYDEKKENDIVVIAIGPAPSLHIDPITGSLKLLS